MTEPNLRTPTDSDRVELIELLKQAKRLATRYQQLTGKPLGITGEIAECEAAAILGLDLHAARTAGYDATEIREGGAVQIQIKGRVVANLKKVVGRVGSIDLRQPFDVVQLVLLDADLNAFAIYEAERPAIEELLTRPGSKARNERGSVGIPQFKAIARLRWAR
ncbi:hypothetical protein GIW50_16545 [Pseudomonas syringae]|uniref:DUF6998 domain-containing protein n=1 Tax=Pseudomonas syringae TaxID=317 RepID=A0A9Q3X1C7_PSESX|nr:hypothetical protein [Pseudomonas syringae]MCF5063045.1 hypothetical protein [Pseudomonas syringae]MCF5119996.1 hypothetical protein [Pseudomonas syringae]MCF5379898.1 hypothetical protein [Pseudomonas syringae]